MHVYGFDVRTIVRPEHIKKNNESEVAFHYPETDAPIPGRTYKDERVFAQNEEEARARVKERIEDDEKSLAVVEMILVYQALNVW